MNGCVHGGGNYEYHLHLLNGSNSKKNPLVAISSSSVFSSLHMFFGLSHFITLIIALVDMPRRSKTGLLS